MVRSNIRERQIASKVPVVSILASLRFSILGGFFNVSPNGNTGNGTSNNTLDYLDQAGNTYQRVVDVALNKIITDEQSGTLAPAGSPIVLPPFIEFAGVARLPDGRQIRVHT